MWPFSRLTIPFEQAVYGSFPFWHRGYDILGASPGCRAEWRSAMKEACQRLGERPRQASPPGGLVTRWLDDGTWLVMHPFSPGSDDVGRPDAVAFHAAFLTPEEARRVRFDPFRLAPIFREDWGAGDSTLEPGTISLRRRPEPPAGAPDPRVGAIVEAIGRGRRALVEATGPIDLLADQVWRALPLRLRHRRSLATWAFTDAGVFDLIGLPRLTGVDPSDPHLLVLASAPVPARAVDEGASTDRDGGPATA